MTELDAAIKEIWGRLEKASGARHGPFRTPTVATVSPQGLPEARVVVLRGASAGSRTLTLHTDTASAKYLAIRHTPHTALCFWDAQSRVQVRLTADTFIEEGDDVKDVLSGLSPAASKQYAISPPPGTPIPDPGAYDYRQAHRFGRILCVVSTMDVLWLTKPRHRRLRADWGEGRWQSAWVVP